MSKQLKYNLKGILEIGNQNDVVPVGVYVKQDEMGDGRKVFSSRRISKKMKKL